MNPIDDLITTSGITYADHTATFRDFMNWCRTASIRDLEKKSTRFLEYIISACWRKMERRVSHWAAVGLMYNIASVHESILLGLVRHVEDSKPDRRLACELISYAKIEEGWKTLSENFPSLAPQVSALYPNTGSQKFPPDNMLLACRKSPYIVYNKTTYIEFHHLLVASTVTFAYFLKHLDEESVEDKPNVAPMVLVVGRLLSAIVQSNAFECHINLLTKFGPLKLPSYASIQDYYEFAQRTFIRIRPKPFPDNTSQVRPKSPTTDAPSPDNEIQTPLESSTADVPSPNDKTLALLESPTAPPDNDCQAPLELPTADKPEPEEDAEPGLQEDSELEFQEDSELDPPSLDDVMISQTSHVIQAWMQYFVSYFEAYRIVKHYGASLGGEGKGKEGDGREDDDRTIKISTLSTTPSGRQLPEWTTVQSIIRSVLNRPDHKCYRQASDRPSVSEPLAKPSAEKIIQIIETSIRSAKKLSSPSVVRAFATILDKINAPAYYTIHCEAALAAYAAMHVKSSGGVASDEPAANVLRV